MPIYEYKCLQCEIHIERRQSISEEPLTICESCGGRLEKLISLSGFQFKGAGWYVTDYAGKKGPDTTASAKTEKNSSTESTVKPETASNTKSETASPVKKESATKD